MEARNTSSALVQLRNTGIFRIKTVSAAAALPSSSKGVVVVGFVSRRHDDSAHLLNRVIDCNVFASGNIDNEEARD
ncbi:hypothetical protein SESBI_04315 [Sesbania bispinosa]|nr:hypothetical protein SESBI_04315 [Sesbania bispinosa]